MIDIELAIIGIIIFIRVWLSHKGLYKQAEKNHKGLIEQQKKTNDLLTQLIRLTAHGIENDTLVHSQKRSYRE